MPLNLYPKGRARQSGAGNTVVVAAGTKAWIKGVATTTGGTYFVESADGGTVYLEVPANTVEEFGMEVEDGLRIRVVTAGDLVVTYRT